MRGPWAILLVFWGTAVLGPLVAQTESREPLWVSGQRVLESGGTYSSSDGSAAVTAIADAVVVLTDAQVIGSEGGGLLVDGGAKVEMLGGAIKTSGQEAPGVLAAGNASATLSDTTVATSGDLSVAVSAGTGGLVVVTGGALKTTGEGSPVLISAGEIRVSGTVATAKASEGAVVEGVARLVIKDSVLVATRNHGVRFVPGAPDGPTGVGQFTMTGGSLTALEGPLFTSSHPSATVALNQVSLVPLSGILVRLEAGSGLSLDADSQILKGDLLVDPDSVLKLTLRNGSTWFGAADQEKTAKEVNVTLEGGSVWTVTADSRVWVLKLEANTPEAANRLIVSGGHTIWYKASVNGWLGGKTETLADGGSLKPY